MKHMRMFWQKLTHTKRARMLSLLSLGILFIVIPLTVILTKQEQELQQRAAQRKPDPSTREPKKRGYVEGVVLLKYKKGTNPTTAKASVEKRLKKKHGRRIKGRLQYIPVEEVEVTAGDETSTCAELTQDANVEYCARDAYVQAVAAPDDPNFDKQYGLRAIKATAAWNVTKGKDVVVAVLDTGIDENHPDLKGKVVGRKNFSYPDKAPDDLSGHGTHVAGIIAAKTDNNEGIAGGCPQCKLLNAKVLKNNEQGKQSTVADGIAWAAQQDAKVINLSVSGEEPNGTFLEDAINEAWKSGVVVVVAAGNDGSSQKTYPAAYKNAIAVAATKQDNKIASFSNYGADWVDVAAPGDNIYSTLPPNVSRNESSKEYGYLQGTSMAAPLVSATAALVIAKNPNLSPSAVRKKIEATTDDVGNKVKFGRINAAKAVGASASEEDDEVGLPPCDINERENNQDRNDNKNKNDKKDNKKNDKKEDKKKDDQTKGDKKKCNKKKHDRKKKGRNTSKKDNDKRNKKITPTKADKKDKENNKNTQASQAQEEDCEPADEEDTEDGEEELGGDGTVLSVSVGLHGIGKGGDNANPNIQGTTDPVTPERDLIIDIYDGNNTAIASTIGAITFDETSGLFKGDIGIDGPPTGVYIAVVRSPTYLSRRAGLSVVLKEKETNELPEVKLIAGDVNDDNQINILDYTILSDCIGTTSPNAEEEEESTEPTPIIRESVCTEQDMVDSDLDDNGEINDADLNLYLREQLTRPGQ
ncbi:MAG: S8 family serine peptidase [Candidatus Levybacteria bacterium]|nr:S8 family serine peptidase [Candidatus Levybacteria bacterium]